MPIGEQTTIASHTGNGVATVFAYSFGVLAAGDIKVLVDGTEVTTGFTVSGIGSRTGGTVTFSVAPASGADILIVREVVRKRDTDYQYSGDLREEVLDDDLDRIWMALQEDGELVARGVRVPVGETLSELPAAASRVDKVLTFGAGGAVALVDIAAFSGGGVVELVPADGSIALVKLTTAVQNLINGALQKSGGTMTGKIVLDGDATLAMHPVPKQQAESIATTAVADRVRFATRVTLPTTSGVAVDLNSLPTWAQRITVILDKVSTNGTDQVCLQLGTASSFETSGYEGSSTTIGVSAVSTSTIGSGGFSLPLGNSASARCGKFVLERVDGNVWQCSGDIADSVTAAVVMVHGRKSISGVLTRIRLTTILGSDAFDAGQVSMIVEGW